MRGLRRKNAHQQQIRFASKASQVHGHILKNLSTAATKIEFSLNVFAEFVEFNDEMLPQSQQDTGNRGNLKN